MNIFATDHPLVSQSPSWFDAKAHPRLSFILSASVLSLCLVPFILVQLYRYAISDIGAEPNPFPQPCLALLVGGVLAFVVGLFCSVPVVLAYRLTVRWWKRQCAEPVAGGNSR